MKCSSSEKQSKVLEYEKQFDLLVYKLYDLTPEEIVIIEGKETHGSKPHLLVT